MLMYQYSDDEDPLGEEPRGDLPLDLAGSWGIEYDMDETGSPISATPSQTVARGDGEDLEGEKGVQPGMEEAPNRQARFVLYWRTTTATSTSTSYTATSTLASLTCTPNGFPLSVCG